ncbi:MAG TPA: efflux RND transporter periplasmic adaptor subunit [Gemmatimonadales bacterium]
MTRWLVLAVPAVLAWGAACADGDDTLTVSGTVEIREVHLAPLAAGRLARLLKDEGDSVRAGDTVAVVEQPGLDALIRERQARAAAASQRTAEIDAALADSTRAANDLARATRLRERQVISAQQYDQLRAAAAAAAARLQSIRAATIDSRAAEAAFRGTLAILDQLTLIAPAPGVIITRFADAGEAVGAGTPVVSLGLVHDPWIRAYVGEPYLARIGLGRPVGVRVDGSEIEFSGRITDISPRAEFTPRAALTERERADLVFAIKVTVDDDPGGRLKAGLPVTLRIALTP